MLAAAVAIAAPRFPLARPSPHVGQRTPPGLRSAAPGASTKKVPVIAAAAAAAPGEANGAPPGLAPSDDDDEVCPVDCVTEFKTVEEFERILARAKKDGALVVVDFYRTSCGSCKYIEQGFTKLCKGSGGADVVFLKHNVIDEYDEQSEVADRLRIKVVPLFHFYKGGILLEAFATRDKEKITAAIQKYSSKQSEPI